MDNPALQNVVEVVEVIQCIPLERRRNVDQLSTVVCHRQKRRSPMRSRIFPGAPL